MRTVIPDPDVARPAVCFADPYDHVIVGNRYVFRVNRALLADSSPFWANFLRVNGVGQRDNNSGSGEEESASSDSAAAPTASVLPSELETPENTAGIRDLFALAHGMPKRIARKTPSRVEFDDLVDLAHALGMAHLLPAGETTWLPSGPPFDVENPKMHPFDNVKELVRHLYIAVRLGLKERALQIIQTLAMESPATDSTPFKHLASEYPRIKYFLLKIPVFLHFSFFEDHPHQPSFPDHIDEESHVVTSALWPSESAVAARVIATLRDIKALEEAAAAAAAAAQVSDGDISWDTLARLTMSSRVSRRLAAFGPGVAHRPALTTHIWRISKELVEYEAAFCTRATEIGFIELECENAERELLREVKIPENMGDLGGHQNSCLDFTGTVRL